MFSYAHEEHILVQQFLTKENKSTFFTFFHVPLSIEAYKQYQIMISKLNNVQLTQGNDTWGYIWGSSNFTSNKAYYKLLGSISVPPVYNWLWKSNYLPKRKVFFWLVLKDRLSTREILRRKNMDLQSYNCVLCHLNIEESLHHLFLDCPFAMCCWNLLGLAHLIQGDVFDTINLLKAQI